MALPNTLYTIPQGWTLPASDQTDFVFFIPASELPQSFYDAIDTSDYTKGRLATNDGTELASDWSEFDHVNQTGGIWGIWTGTLSSTSNPVPRVYPPKSANASYDVTSTFGRNAVWKDYEIVLHLNEDPSGSAPQFIDATGNGYDGTAVNMDSSNRITSSLGYAIQFNGVDEYITLASLVDVERDTNIAPMAMGGWANVNDPDESHIHGTISADDDMITNVRTNNDRMDQVSGGQTDFYTAGKDVAPSTWHRYEYQYGSGNGNNALYFDGALGDPDEGGTNSSNYQFDTIGRAETTFARVNEHIQRHLTVRNFTPSGDMYALEYANQNDPATFWGTWSIVEPQTGADYTVEITKGSYAFSGKNVDPLTEYLATIQKPSYNFSGKNVDILQQYYGHIEKSTSSFSGKNVDAIASYISEIQKGSYSLNAKNVDPIHSALVQISKGSYVFSGKNVIVDYVEVADYVVEVSKGSYVLGEKNVDAKVNFRADIQKASSIFSGKNMDALVAFKVDVGKDSFSLSTKNIDTSVSYRLATDKGSYTLNGRQSQLLHSALATIQKGIYTFSGKESTLIVVDTLPNPEVLRLVSEIGKIQVDSEITQSIRLNSPIPED